MPEAQHNPKSVKTYHVGCDSDTEPELLKDGFAIDQLNMRSTNQGDEGADKKINGEVIKFPNIDNRCSIGSGSPLPLSYRNIGDCKVNDHIVEFWADASPSSTGASFVRIDGQIVLMSSKFPITFDHPLQIDVDDSCVGGDIFITDFNVPPMLFNVEDLMTNSGMLPNTTCTDKYFASFNIDLYVLQLAFQVDHPVFMQLATTASGKMIPIGSGGGKMEVGCYQYAIRFVDATGNRTRLSPFTPLITVPKTLSGSSAEYPYSMTQGGNGGTPTTFGIHFRVRLTNINAYDQMEIIRAEYIGETPIGTIPQLKVIHAEKLSTHKTYDVLDFYDAGTVTPLDIVTEQEEPDALGGIDAAKGIRYFNKRVHLMNIKYASRDIDALGFNQSSQGREMYPVMKKLNKKGFSDPYHSTYDRSYMNGEKYGFSTFLWDSFANRTFAKAVPNFTNFQFPNRREKMAADSQAQSFEGRVKAATDQGTAATPGTEVSDTFEVFDHYNAVNKNLCEFSDARSFKNIIDKSAQFPCVPPVNPNRRVSGVLDAYCGNLDSGLIRACPPDRVFTQDIGYQPFTPVPGSTDVTSHRYVVNPHVEDPITGNGYDYNPTCFGLNYYSMGITLQGLNNIPSFASGFSVARTEPAKRVIMQGVGFYRIVSGLGTGSAVGKNTKAFCFYSPDSDNTQGLVSAAKINDIIANPGNYEIIVQSSLGFFSEIYNTQEKGVLGGLFQGIGRSRAVDMICYARILRDSVASPVINPNESPLMGINGGDTFNYVGFGKWRQPALNTSSPFPYAKGDEASSAGVFELTKVIQYASLNNDTNLSIFNSNPNGRGNFLVLKTDREIYNMNYSGSGSNNTSSFSALQMQNWHEPIYIVNIVEKNVNVVNNNINSFIDTGTYVKIKSIIGISDGSDPQNFVLVDERWEDCCPALDNTWQNFGTMSIADRFITVKDKAGVELKWLNVTYKNGGQRTAILTDIQNNGFYIASGVKIYGVYTHTTSAITSVSDAVEVKLNFTRFDTAFPKSFFIPSQGSSIIVAYDNTVPVRVFGGDSVSGQSIFSPIDMKYNSNGEPDGSADSFGMDVGFPFNFYKTNPRHYIIRNSKPTLGGIIADWQDCDAKFKPGSAALIRQMCVMFPCTSRIHSPYFVQDTITALTNFHFFPSVNYIMRPIEWDSGDTQHNIFSQYFTDYPGEDTQWNWGGFRFMPLTNIDYSKEETIQSFSSKPATGFKPKTAFCSRDVWSAPRLTNVQNDPNVRTFPALNFKDIEDRQGEIKFAWDALTNSGSNLYAVCERGIALLLVDKKILQEVAGNQLATMGVSDTNVVLEEVWISKTIGMNDEFWRSAAEWDNILFFSNKNSSYRLMNNKLDDVGRKNYHRRLYNDYLSKVLPSYQTDMCAVYDTLHNEYWVQFRKKHRLMIPIFFVGNAGYIYLNITNPNAVYPIKDGDVIDIFDPNNNPIVVRLPPMPLNFHVSIRNTNGLNILVYNANNVLLNIITFGNTVTFTGTNDPLAPTATNGIVNEFRGTLVFSQKNEYWFGKFDFSFDKYLSFDNKTYGMRENETYELNKGFTINKKKIRGETIGVCNDEEQKPKEFVRMRVNSDTIPTRIEFFDDMSQVDANAPETFLDIPTNVLALKKRYGYEQYVPRRSASPNRRMQGRKLIFKVIHEDATDFKIVSTEVSYKALK